MLNYSTQSQPSHAKVSYWNEAMSEVFSPLETRPLQSGPFEASAAAAPLGRLLMVQIDSTPARIIRTRQHVANCRAQKFFLHLQVEGRLRLCQDNKEALLKEGDLALSDCSLPYTLDYDDHCKTMVLVMSADDLKQHLPNPDEVVGVRLAGTRGLAHTTSVMLSSLWTQARDRLPHEVGLRVSESVLDVFAAAWLTEYGVKVADSAVSGSRRVQIKRYIDARLRDPELSARTVAAAFRITPRYLHMLFAKEGETVSNYILRRRLEQCVKQLADPLWSKRTITEIAFGWGFNNATHFGRVFRHHYEMTPSDYRSSLMSRGLREDG